MEPHRGSGAVGELVATCGDGLERSFPDLFFDWYPKPDELVVEVTSRYGTVSRLVVGYPLDVHAVYDGARRHVERDAERELLAERLVAVAGVSDRDVPAGHRPYVFRWLVHPQGAGVELGDHAGVEPVLRSPSVALVRRPTRILKVWADGTAVMHDARSDPSAGDYVESRGMDLAQMTLCEFQHLWLTGETDLDLTTPPPVLVDFTRSASERAAVTLLRGYDDGVWLRRLRSLRGSGPVDGGSINWTTANRLSVTHTEATLQDRAVLAIACHLSDCVEPLVSLPDALHYVGSGRAEVMKALIGLAGLHPDPQGTWPTDCPSCS